MKQRFYMDQREPRSPNPRAGSAVALAAQQQASIIIIVIIFNAPLN
jgi:hypothetical protein